MLSAGFLKTQAGPRARCGRRLARGVSLIGALVLAAGCNSAYVRNRAMDARDVFTVQAESQSYGAALRVGPLKAGLSYKSAEGRSLGLRGGETGESYSADFTAFFFGADYFSSAPIRFDSWRPEPRETSETADKAQPAEEEKAADEVGEADTAGEVNEVIAADAANAATDADPAAPETTARSRMRNKEFRALAPFGTEKAAHRARSLARDEDVDWAPPAYFTQLEVSLGLYGGVRLGINPGELLDLLLGLFTIDLYSDDEPYADPIERQLLENPMFRSLDPATRARILEQIRRGELSPPLGP